MPARAFERSRSERLEDIVAWGQKAAGFIARMQLGEFARDEKTLIAVSKCVEVVGEAAAQLLKAFPEVQIEHPDLELAAARAMRNRLSHGYFAGPVGHRDHRPSENRPAAQNALAPEARGG